MNELQKIQVPVAAEMAQCRERFDLSFRHDSPLLSEALEIVGSHKGKMMRPLLVLLVSKLFDGIDENAQNIACAYEAFHTASLVHDDVVDESDERRGQRSVNSTEGNKVAVLVGDYILASALHYLSLTGMPELVDIMSEAARSLAEGELLQLYNTEVQGISEEIYFKIIRNKTAALFAACTHSAALNAHATSEQVEKLKTFGEIVGICFQIRDDIFDYYDSSEIGKPTGNDMAEGKLTLPAIHAILSTGNEEMKAIALKVRAHDVTQEEIARLVAFTKENGGIEYAEQTMERLHSEAMTFINERVGQSELKEALKAYLDFVIQRKL